MIIMTTSRHGRHGHREGRTAALNVAEAKKQFSDLLGRVAYGGETILILRRGKPMARLVPPEDVQRPHLADARGWLEDEDPLFSILEDRARKRGARYPRVLKHRRGKPDSNA
jgi:prevent-host-death family protein